MSQAERKNRPPSYFLQFRMFDACHDKCAVFCTEQEKYKLASHLRIKKLTLGPGFDLNRRGTAKRRKPTSLLVKPTQRPGMTSTGGRFAAIIHQSDRFPFVFIRGTEIFQRSACYFSEIWLDAHQSQLIRRPTDWLVGVGLKWFKTHFSVGSINGQEREINVKKSMKKRHRL